MVDRNKVIEIIYVSIDDINEDRDEEDKLKKTEETILLGQDGALDSFGLVSLIVATEQNIEEEFGVTLVLADEKAMSQRNSPFRTVNTFTDHITTLLEEKKDG